MIIDSDDKFYDYYITIVEIDMMNMLIITNDNEFNKMNKKYYKKWKSSRQC